jgi:carbon monoxide dehydrogenase subunit G
MELSGHHIFNAPQQRVWEVLTDPDTLRTTLPGCQKFEPLGDGSYDVSLTIGIAAVKGTYTGKVRLADAQPPDAYTLEVEARGSAGFVKGQGHFTLSPVAGDPAQTRVEYTGDAHVGGPVAGVGQRLVKAGAQLIAGQFFKALDKKVAA